MLRRLYDWTMGLAGRRHAMSALGVVAFIESSIFPIPPDVLILPMVLAKRERWLRIATVATLGSVLGGVAGYFIGYFLFDSFGRPLLAFYGYGDEFAEFRSNYNEWGAWIVAFFGLTPFPYKVITIASGVTQLDLAAFMAASVASRGARFFLEAALLWKFGEPIRGFIEKYLGWLAAAFLVLLFGGFVALKYL
jgi:membrane protein YqaA with SNARE-associated domain